MVDGIGGCPSFFGWSALFIKSILLYLHHRVRLSYPYRSLNRSLSVGYGEVVFQLLLFSDMVLQETISIAESRL